MDEVLQFLVVLVSLLIIILTLRYYRQRWPVANFPPGPTGLPIIGTRLYTGIDFHRTARKLAHGYGNVCSFMLGKPMVLANDFDAINEVFNRNKGFDFASRRESAYVVGLSNPKKLGLFDSDYSERWEQHRRFVVSTLRGFGFGKSSFEGKITEEVQNLLSHLKDLAKVPQDLSNVLTLSVSSIVCNLVLGCRYDHSSKEFLHIVDTIEKFMSNFGKTSMVLMEFVPISRPFLQRSVQEMRDIYAEFSSVVMSRVADRQKTFSADKEPQNFVDCYLAKMMEQPDIFSLEDLEIVLRDLFGASMESTSNTIMFALLYLVANPDVQEKVHEELMTVVGPSQLPCLEDRDRLPYTVATIYESQRLGSVTPVISRCATVDTTLAGYAIPKGTNVICNTWGLHYDPDIWPDPYRFDPTRHLNNDGEVIKSPYLVPFGGGRRVCMGESLAKMELFLYFCSLMHQFKFELPPGAEMPSMEPMPGFNASPQSFTVMIKEYVNTSIPYEPFSLTENGMPLTKN
ncbi:cytochrome P450 2U1-like [Amphiura filiformis]|uniref:cytochrome P450 2U1-like n=1 Tax=Amphiura filiformis TaxID=82378 RepID=UPI003B2215A3